VQVVRPNSSMVGPLVMLALVISKIFHSEVPFEIVHVLGHFVSYPKNLISIYLDQCLTELFVMPTAIALSQWTGVLGCWWPWSFNVC
jgi:hypothetical protein